MKVRSGFVSNSSSSSFIVHIFDKWKLFKGHVVESLTKKEIRLLEQHGFYPCLTSDPQFLSNEDRERERIEEDKVDAMVSYETAGKKCPKYKIEYMGVRVVCNQDFPISFLLYYDIPFIGSVHYGHHTYVYKRGWKDVIVMHNYGVMNDYGDCPEEMFEKKKDREAHGVTAYKIPKKQFLKWFSKEEIADQIKSNKYL
jgi:hypothetical protein